MPVLPLEMDTDAFRWLAAFALSLIVALAGRRSRSLSADGAAAAVIVGTLLVGTVGWPAGLLIVQFFITSGALSRVVRVQHPDTGVKGDQRDAFQVFANGGVATALGVVSTVWNPESVLFLGVIVSIAAATADTWATELGRLSRQPPRMITNLMRVQPGTSGAITVAGTVAAIVGAASISILAAIMHNAGWWALSVSAVTIIAIGTVGGVAGALVDSLFGATIQGTWWCPVCRSVTEARVHRCGTRAVLVSGRAGVNNDAVNALSIAAGCLIAIAIALV